MSLPLSVTLFNSTLWTSTWNNKNSSRKELLNFSSVVEFTALILSQNFLVKRNSVQCRIFLIDTLGTPTFIQFSDSVLNGYIKNIIMFLACQDSSDLKPAQYVTKTPIQDKAFLAFLYIYMRFLILGPLHILQS